ncbi:MAG TPA: hypothetical protein EYQ09_04755, partial [Flavobacteriales bacterium]|nr:hypothetical protein [Flavobacteriales bacterium]
MKSNFYNKNPKKILGYLMVFAMVLFSGNAFSQCSQGIGANSESFEDPLVPLYGQGPWAEWTLDAATSTFSGTNAWRKDNLGTGSSGTGPINGQPSADGAYYLYCETSGQYSKIANLHSNCIDLNNFTAPSFVFSYHMLGATMGTLNVDVSTDGAITWTNIWTKTGDQGSAWLDGVIDLGPSYAGQIIQVRMNYTSGTSYTGDCAIDWLRFMELPLAGCMDPFASNYDSTANIDDGSCLYPGCMDQAATNYCSSCNVNDSASCIYPQANALDFCDDFESASLTTNGWTSINGSEGGVSIHLTSANAIADTVSIESIGASAAGGWTQYSTEAQAFANLSHVSSATILLDMSASTGPVDLAFDYATQSGFTNTAPGLPGTAYSTMRVKVNGTVVQDVNGVSWHGSDGSLVYDLSSYAGQSQVAVTFETACKYNSLYSSGAYGDYVWIDNVCAFNVTPCTYYGIDAVVSDDASCNGSSDGSASASVTGMNTSFTYSNSYSWTDAAGAVVGTSSTVSGLAAGTYTCTVSDTTNGCTASASVTIIEPSAIVISAIVLPATSPINTDGAVDITVSGGTPCATSDTVIPGPHVSNYTSTFTRGYYFQAQSSFSISGVRCSDDNTPGTGAFQSVEIVDLGTSPAVPYPGPGGPHTTLFSAIGDPMGWIPCNVNVVAGNYYGVIGAKHAAAGGASQTMYNSYGQANPSVTIDGNATTLTRFLLQGSLAAGSPASGSYMAEVSSSIGRIEIATGVVGANAYTYAWSIGDTTEDVSNLGMGPISVTATDCNGCTGTWSGFIMAANVPGCLDTLASNYDPAANSDCVGAVGGTDYSCCLYPGCTDSLANNFDPMANVSDSSCTYSCAYYGLTDIEIVVTNGTFPTEVGWDIVDANGVIVASAQAPTGTGTFNVCMAWGCYTLNMTDTYGDGWNGATFSVNDVATGYTYATGTLATGSFGSQAFCLDPCSAFSLSATVTDVSSCNGGSDGSIDMNTLAGASYSWSNGATTEDISGLSAGVYTVIASNGTCSDTLDVTVGQPAVITAMMLVGNESSAGAGDGQIDLTVSGGTACYTGSPILITEYDPGAPDALEIQNVTDGPVDVTGWTVTISNSYANINIANTIVQTLSGSMASGATETWTDASTNNYWGNNIFWNPGAYPTFAGWIMIKDASGTVMDVFVANWPAANIATSTLGLSGMWIGNGYDQTAIPAGSSASRITQGNDASAFVTTTNSLGVTNTGLSLPFASAGAYAYAWSNGDTTEDITGLSAGQYCVTVTDCNGCSATFCDSVGTSATLGCMDPLASNYNPFANVDDGSCLYPGCTDSLASNYDPTANVDDGSCTYSCAYYGLTDITVTVTTNPWPSEVSWDITDANGVIVASSPANAIGTFDICLPFGCYNFNMYDSFGDGWNGSIYTISNTNNGIVYSTGTLITGTFGTDPFCFDPCSSFGISLDNSGNASCAGVNDGFVDVSTGVCTIWNWLDNGSNNGNRQNMAAGNYTLVAMTCDSACTDTLNVTITEPSAMIATMAITNASAAGVNDGAIDLSVSGGTPCITAMSLSSHNPLLSSNGQSGIHFNIINTSASPLTITDFSQGNYSSYAINNMSAWYIPGGMGIPLNAAAGWTQCANNVPLVGATPGTFAAPTYSAPWAITPVVIPAGATYGFYIQGTGSFSYATATAAGAVGSVVASDANLSITSGYGGTPLGAGSFSPRAPVIEVYYGDPNASAYTFAWSTSDTTEDVGSLLAGWYCVTVTDCNGCSASFCDSVGISLEPGCTDPLAVNYSPTANFDDGSCIYMILGCDDSTAFNYNPLANTPDPNDPCCYQSGCMDPFATNYDASVCWNDSTLCTYPTANVSPFCEDVESGSTSTNGWLLAQQTYASVMAWGNGATFVVNGHPGNNGPITGNYSLKFEGGDAPTGWTQYSTEAQRYANTTHVSSSTVLVDLTGAASACEMSFDLDLFSGFSNVGYSSMRIQVDGVVIPDVNGNTSYYNGHASFPVGCPASTITYNLSAYSGSVINVMFEFAGKYSTNYSSGLYGNIALVDDICFYDLQPCTYYAASAVVDVDVSCNGGNDGSATASTSGGSGSDSYAWSDGQTTATAIGLSAGSYCCVVTDATLGCVDSVCVTISEPSAISLSAAVVNESAAGANDGQIDLTVSGGTPCQTSAAVTAGAHASVYTGYARGWSFTAQSSFNLSHVRAADATILDPSLVEQSIEILDITSGVVSIYYAANQPTGWLATGGLSIVAGNTYAIVGAKHATNPVAFGMANSYGGSGQSFMIDGISTPVMRCGAQGNLSMGQVNAGGGTWLAPTAGSIGRLEIMTGVVGANAYTFSWDNGASTEDISGLSAGAYCVTVTDCNGCVAGPFCSTIIIAGTPGCMDSTASNYNSNATIDDGSCLYPGCTDSSAANYDPTANIDDGSCNYCFDNDVTITVGGGSWMSEVGWSLVDGSGVTVASGGAPFTGIFCLADDCYTMDMTDSYGDGWNGSTYSIDDNNTGTNYGTGGLTAGMSAGSDQVSIGAACGVYGCTDSTATNYDPLANIDDGSCIVPGCTDSTAANYNPLAT